MDQVSRAEDSSLRHSAPKTPGECDGCGTLAPAAIPAGWADRAVDPPFYTGARRLLFCPDCVAALPAAQRRRWQRLVAPAPVAGRWSMAVRRLFPRQPPRRGTIG